MTENKKPFMQIGIYRQDGEVVKDSWVDRAWFFSIKNVTFIYRMSREKKISDEMCSEFFNPKG